MPNRHLATFEVQGRPATFATAGEAPWKDAVRQAVQESGCQPTVARFYVRIDFRLGPQRTAGEVWDLDNLIKPTLDAMEGVFGLREWRGRPQPADDRVDRIEAAKGRLATANRPARPSTSGSSSRDLFENAASELERTLRLRGSPAHPGHSQSAPSFVVLPARPP